MSGAPPHAAVIEPARAVRGRLEVPGDKSISHRYALLAALGDGRSRLTAFAPGEDCAATLACVEALGARVQLNGHGNRGEPGHEGTIEIIGVPHVRLQKPAAMLDARNSGTT